MLSLYPEVCFILNRKSMLMISNHTLDELYFWYSITKTLTREIKDWGLIAKELEQLRGVSKFVSRNMSTVMHLMSTTNLGVTIRTLN